MGDITTATLIISGAHDFICGPRWGRMLHEGIPDAQFLLLEDSGHMGTLRAAGRLHLRHQEVHMHLTPSLPQTAGHDGAGSSTPGPSPAQTGSSAEGGTRPHQSASQTLGELKRLRNQAYSQSVTPLDDGRLIGRDRDLARLGAFADQAAAQGGAFVLLGEAGVGKSVLLAAAAARATAAGHRVLSASGSQFEGEVSYAGLHQVLQPLFDDLPTLTPAHERALRVALGLGEGAAPGRLLVANAALMLLRQAAAPRPLLVVVDDIAWLDRASAVVLSFVARRLTGSRAGLLAAARSEEESFFEYGGLPGHELQPLAEQDAAALLKARFPALSPRIHQRLLADAQGNPLALLELPVALGDLQRGGTLPPVLPLSGRLQTVFAARIRGLPLATFGMLLLAVLDGTGDLTVLDTGALAPAEQARLVRVDASAGKLLFRHPLIGSAVMEMSTSEQRHRAHLLLAERLADQPERRAWHLAEAAAGPDEGVAALLQAVAHANLRRGDSVHAITLLLRAAELSPADIDRAGRLGEAAYLGAVVNGDLRDAPHLLEQARRADRRGESLAAAVAGAYHLLNGDGDVDSAHRLMAGAIEVLDDPGDAHNKPLIEGLYTLLMICFFSGRAELWQAFHAAVGRLRPGPPALLDILAKTFSNPARLALPALDRLDAVIANLHQEIIPARISRIGIATAYVDRLGTVPRRVVAGHRPRPRRRSRHLADRGAVPAGQRLLSRGPVAGTGAGRRRGPGAVRAARLPAAGLAGNLPEGDAGRRARPGRDRHSPGRPDDPLGDTAKGAGDPVLRPAGQNAGGARRRRLRGGLPAGLRHQPRRCAGLARPACPVDHHRPDRGGRARWTPRRGRRSCRRGRAGRTGRDLAPAGDGHRRFGCPDDSGRVVQRGCSRPRSTHPARTAGRSNGLACSCCTASACAATRPPPRPAPS
ncbi:ATP-binding protein [Nonomuraea roseola]|uniref:ATP-binding protein n=1 Tax=Nonomuraea roseola TaxID=46179 RepID=UPI0031F7DBCA